MVNRSVKESDLTITDRKAHCPLQTSYNRTTHATVVTKEVNLPSSKINQANGIINRTSSTVKSTKHKILKGFHQNIQGLKNKRNELISSLYSATPHVLCLTEHNMKRQELKNCRLGAKYCRQSMEKGVSIFVQKNLKFTNVYIEEYCLYKDTEACALKLKSTFSNICVLALYGAPSGNFSEFLNRLEFILNILHTQKN
jgi:hypothetical protein